MQEVKTQRPKHTSNIYCNIKEEKKHNHYQMKSKETSLPQKHVKVTCVIRIVTIPRLMILTQCSNIHPLSYKQTNKQTNKRTDKQKGLSMMEIAKQNNVAFTL
jgi:hypothetical protein